MTHEQSSFNSARKVQCELVHLGLLSFIQYNVNCIPGLQIARSELLPLVLSPAICCRTQHDLARLAYDRCLPVYCLPEPYCNQS